MQNRRRGLFQRLQGLFQRMINAGGAAEEPTPPILREEQPRYEQESFQPLPTSGQQQYEEQYVVEETTITPGVIQGSNIEYIPSYYSTGRNGGRYPVYGRYRVSDPALGDVQDLMNTSPDTEVTFVVVGELETYTGYPAMGKSVASYRIDVSRMNYLMSHTPADSMEEVMNEYLAQTGDEWTYISQIQIVNKQDRPQ